MLYSAAVIGLGQIGLMYDFDEKRSRPSSHVLAYELNPSVKLEAGVDTRAGQQAYLWQYSPEAQFFQSVSDMLNNCRPDLVSICSPPEFHFDTIRQILAAYEPKVIFCEKPVVSDRREAESLLQLLGGSSSIIVPNLTRRWLPGFVELSQRICNKRYGALKNIHMRYTRGIYNTGSHLFDLVHWFAGPIKKVLTLGKKNTSADDSGDPSYSFYMETDWGVTGFAEAFDDRSYYMFELDLYFDSGKVEIRDSGDYIGYWNTGDHRLFSGFRALSHEGDTCDILEQNSLQHAMEHLVELINSGAAPRCTVMDGIRPLYVAEAIERSAQSGKWEYPGEDTYE